MFLLQEISEGSEDEDFWKALGGKQEYNLDPIRYIIKQFMFKTSFYSTYHAKLIILRCLKFYSYLSYWVI